MDNLINNQASKIFLMLDSLKEFNTRYIAIIDPNTGDKIMKIKTNLDNDNVTELLDAFFDEGFIVESINKKEFDDLITGDVIRFNFDSKRYIK